jgi:hypothetical protein
MPTMSNKTISINRFPVLTLWATVVAERLGYKEDEALSLGKAFTGLTAQAKGRRLGIIKPSEHKPRESPRRLFGRRLARADCLANHD